MTPFDTLPKGWWIIALILLAIMLAGGCTASAKTYNDNDWDPECRGPVITNGSDC